MGENMEEADEFDRVMQSVAEGTYHPSSSSSPMETFPVSVLELLFCISLHSYYFLYLFDLS